MFGEISLLSSYLKTALRNLARHRIYSAINIIGIAIGLAFCILTYLFVQNEWTYDTFHENADRIYRVSGTTPEPLGPAIAEAFPDMQTVRFSSSGGKIGTEDRAFRATLGFVDPNFLDIFSFPVIHGDPAQALQDKYSVIITKKSRRNISTTPTPSGNSFPFSTSGKKFKTTPSRAL